ncbi:hypothetical protein [Rhizobium leguminosarum]|uniref:hypothetical protein n=1 Tax=Rhizobium leguminosarum TaxID=384 RepID=UPI001AE5888D|nr:hypothetical protein [Rhizobium leguminosarum]MBP2444080.1 hypothetical protein [Rhizobium leguminosarum]
MRPTINPPSLIGDDEVSYQTECQFALEPSIVSLLDKVGDAGWDRRHAALAIVAVASALLNDRDQQTDGGIATPLV